MPFGMTQRRPLLDVTRQTCASRTGMAAAWRIQRMSIAIAASSQIRIGLALIIEARRWRCQFQFGEFLQKLSGD